MINSELRQYCQGIIGHYSKEYPYYVMCTDTSVDRISSYTQNAVIYFSKEEPETINQYSFKSDSWFVITVKSSNASYNDSSPRISTGTRNGTINIDDYEYEYSNLESNTVLSQLDYPNYYSSYKTNQISLFFAVLNSAILLACVVALWLKR